MLDNPTSAPTDVGWARAPPEGWREEDTTMPWSRHPILATVLPCAVAVVLGACSGEASEGASTPRETSLSAVPAATATLAERATSAASAVPTGRAPTVAPSTSTALTPIASASAPRVRGPALPQRSTSPGVIDCEDVICDVATQMCCSEWDDGKPSAQMGRCAPNGPAGCGTRSAVWRSCDESLDCAQGESCCYVPAWDGGYAQMVCHAGACEAPEYETCLAGGQCKNGKKCKAEKGAAAGHCP
jgi:hypothetical protein